MTGRRIPHPMYAFLSNNRDELIERCKAKVALRPHRTASEEQLSKGVPLFLEQLVRTLLAEKSGHAAESLRISGASGGDGSALSEMGASAAAHGKELLALGFTVDQVVHAYGDLCQSITDLAVERDAPFLIDEFRTLNRCLDNAIADAVSAFSERRDRAVATRHFADEGQRLASLLHELRNDVRTATLAFGALEAGRLAIGGSTSALLGRSLASLTALIEDATSGVRLASDRAVNTSFSVASLIAEAAAAASLYARASGCTLTVPVVEPSFEVSGNRVLLSAALMNLLQNAFKFTKPQTVVMLTTHATDERVFVEVHDACGGLPAGTEALFRPFSQGGADRSGLGLGLSIARRSVEACGGSLNVRDLPGTGCVFTIDLPREA